MGNDILAFLSAVKDQWIEFWGGLLMTALGAFYSYVRQQQIPGRLLIGLGAVFLAIACFGAWRSEHAEVSKLTAQVEALRSAGPVGFLQIAKIEVPTDFNSIAAGKRFAFNFHSSNPGPGRVFGAAGISKFIMADDVDMKTADQTVRKLFEKDRSEFEQSYRAGSVSGVDIGVQGGPWMTSPTLPLTQEQVTGFTKGTSRFYWLNVLMWKDSRGQIESLSDCRWLQPLPIGNVTLADVVWHFCE